MKPVQKLKIFSLLMAMPFVTNADLDCDSGRLFDVSGSTHTNSLSAEVQSGIMHLELRNAPLDPVPVYTFNCGLIGKIVEQTVTGSKLDHTVICNSKDSFNTSEDVATVTGVSAIDENGNPTSLSVHEVISNIEEGKGLFKNMRADITATGTVNISTGINEFDLTGEVCLKKKN